MICTTRAGDHILIFLGKKTMNPRDCDFYFKALCDKPLTPSLVLSAIFHSSKIK